MSNTNTNTATSTGTSTNTPVYGTGNLKLPEDFQPCSHTVIIGRGHIVQSHPGNRRFRELVQEELEEYTSPEATRSSKSLLIMKVIQKVKNQSLLGVGFVKLNPQDGRWYALEDLRTRTSVGQAFRDLVPQQRYKSSKHSKQAKRFIQKTVGPSGEGNEQSSSSSSWMGQQQTNSIASSSSKRTSVASSLTNSSDSDLDLSMSKEELFDRLWALACTSSNLQGQDGSDMNPFEPLPLPEGRGASVEPLPLNVTWAYGAFL